MLYYLSSSLFLLCLVFTSCGSPGEDLSGNRTVTQSNTPQVTNFPARNLEMLKAGIDRGTADYLSARDAVVRRADQELTGEVYTIVNKEILPPSGDPHDYLSIGPYWWPDPEKEDGLPWIQRDGEVNPITQGDKVDKTQRGDFIDAVNALTYAHYLTGEEKYAVRADTLLRAWFIDSATRMNPSLDYAQGIPGRTTGRCFGIIELRGLIDIVTDLQILSATGGLSEETKAGVDDWFSDYLDWLQNSELGQEEAARPNNHSTWYDTQVLAYLIYLGRTDEARQVAEGVKGRVDEQIDGDGRQPEELSRTKTLHYSTFNLEAFVQLAYYGQLLGIDLWDYQSPSGGSIHQAFEFLAPTAAGDEEWTLPTIGDLDDALANTRDFFSVAGNYFGLPEYCEIGSAGAAETLPLILYRCE